MDVLDQLLKEIGVRSTTEASKKGVWRDGMEVRERERERDREKEREREREREAGYAPGGRGYREESERKGVKRGGMSNEIRYSISSDKRNCTFERSSSMLRLSNSVSRFLLLFVQLA